MLLLMDLTNAYTTKTAAKALGLSYQQVSEMCRKGRIEATRIGRAYIISSEAVKAYETAESRKTAPPNKPDIPPYMREKIAVLKKKRKRTKDS